MRSLEVDLVILDLDETLLKTEEATFGIENQIASSMGFPPMTRETHRQTWGINIEAAIQERFPGINIPEFMSKFIDIVSHHAAKGNLDVISPKNLEVLDKLSKREKKLSILTSRTLDEMRHLIDPNHVLSSRIARFYHKDNTDFCKPDPRVFINPLRDFAIKPDRTVYIGDSRGDGLAATGAGLHFIATLESGFRNEEDFRGIQVNAFIHQFSEILEIIR